MDYRIRRESWAIDVVKTGQPNRANRTVKTPRSHISAEIDNGSLSTPHLDGFGMLNVGLGDVQEL